MFVRLALVAALVSACGGGHAGPDAAIPDAGAPDAYIPPPVGNFPVGFLWGTAIAPYQVEGGLHDDDWYAWETKCTSCSGDHADDGPDFWDHYDEDFANAQSIGNTSIRLGIEWSRIFPTEASFPDSPDSAAVQHYHDILASAKLHGLVPMVTLDHFALPIWLDDPNNPSATPAWQDPAMVDLFAAWAGWCAKEYGGEVDWWITINEPVAYVGGGWIAGSFPPGHSLDVDGAVAAVFNMVLGSARAYDAIHANDTTDADGDGKAAMVSISSHNRVFQPVKMGDAADEAAAEQLRQFNNLLFFDALVYGNVDRDFDGNYDGPNDSKNDPTLAGRVDFLGVNYYGISLVASTGSPPPFSGAPFMNDLDRYGFHAPETDFGWAIYPDGFREVLDELQPYGLPILVTENGIADADDGMRPRFLADHLYVLAKAINDGIDVRGYYHWSLTDNFEWASGFCPRFGLWHIDPTDATKTRTKGAGADVYHEIIQAGTVPVDLFRRYPGYPPPSVACPRVGL